MCQHRLDSMEKIIEDNKTTLIAMGIVSTTIFLSIFTVCFFIYLATKF